MYEKSDFNFEICTVDERNHQGTDFFRVFLIFYFILSCKWICDMKHSKSNLRMNLLQI